MIYKFGDMFGPFKIEVMGHFMSIIRLLSLTYRNCKRDHSTCHTCDDTARIQHCAILSKSNEKPAKLKRESTHHDGTFASHVVDGQSSNDTSKHGTHVDQGLEKIKIKRQVLINTILMMVMKLKGHCHVSFCVFWSFKWLKNET